MEKKDSLVRKELHALLVGGNSHMTFEEVVDGFPISRINEKAPNMPYAPWHILEHVRRAQHDIISFIQDPAFESPPWPQGYFPSRLKKPAPISSSLLVHVYFFEDTGCTLFSHCVNSVIVFSAWIGFQTRFIKLG